MIVRLEIGFPGSRHIRPGGQREAATPDGPPVGLSYCSALPAHHEIDPDRDEGGRAALRHRQVAVKADLLANGDGPRPNACSLHHQEPEYSRRCRLVSGLMTSIPTRSTFSREDVADEQRLALDVRSAIQWEPPSQVELEPGIPGRKLRVATKGIAKRQRRSMIPRIRLCQ